jgi:hypothetical protein
MKTPLTCPFPFRQRFCQSTVCAKPSRVRIHVREGKGRRVDRSFRPKNKCSANGGDGGLKDACLAETLFAAGVWDREVGFLWHCCALAVQGVERERACECVCVVVVPVLRSGI